MGEYRIKKAETRLMLRERTERYQVESLNTIDKAVEFLQTAMSELDVENIWVINLNSRNNPINYSITSIGTLTSSIAEPAQIFKTAILSNACRLIMAHNHPSEDPTPSPEDLEVTKRMIGAGRILGIPVLDHIIIAGRSFHYSFKENMPELFD